MASRWRRLAVILAVIGAFAVLVTATALRWPLWTHILVPAAALLAVSVLAGRSRASRRPPELSASDAYSDAYLGRTPPTHPHRETRAASQIGTALPPDPLRLPPGVVDPSPPARG